MADIFEIIPPSALSGIKAADEGLKHIDSTFLSLTGTIRTMNETLEKGGISLKELSKAQKKAAENASELSGEQKKIADIDKKVKENTDEVVKARILASQASKEQKEAITNEINAKNKLIGTEQKIINDNKKLLQERKKLIATDKNYERDLKRINAQLEKNDAQLKKVRTTTERNRMGVGGYQKAITNALSQLGFMPPALTKVATAQELMNSATNRGTKAMRVLKFALASTGIGLIVIAIGSLIAYFKSSEEGASKLSKVMGIIGVVVGNLSDIFANIGKVIFSAFENPKQAVSDLWEFIKGQFVNRIKSTMKFFSAFGDILSGIWELDTDKIKQGAKDAGNAYIDMFTGVLDTNKKVQEGVKGFIKETNDEVKESIRLNELKLETDRLERKLIVERAGIEARVAQLRLKARQDDDYTAKQRIVFLNEANELQTELLDKDTQVAKNRLEIQRINNSFSKSTQTNLDDEAKLQAEISKIEAARYNQSRMIQRETNRLNKEILREKIKDEKEYNDFLKQLDEDADALIEEGLAKDLEIAQAKIDMNQSVIDADQKAKDDADAKDKERRERLKAAALDTAMAVGNALGTMLAKQEITFKQFSKQLLQIVLSSVQAQVRIYMAGILARETFTKGFAGIATAALIVAGIEAAFSAAKALIPQFYMGTNSAPDGLLSVAERGPELIETKTGQKLLATKPTIMSGIGGARIYDSQETRLRMARGDATRGGGAILINDDNIVSAIENQTHYHFETDRVVMRRGNYSEVYINTKLRGVN